VANAAEADSPAPKAAGPPPVWRPWTGRPGASDLLCLAGIIVSGLYNIAMIPLTPALIAIHPLLLALLSGSTSSVVAAGSFSGVSSKFQFVAVVAAGVIGMMRFDWVFWWAGRLWGHRMVEKLSQHSPRTAAMAGTVERRGVRFAAPLVAASAFLPGGASAASYAAAGWAGLPLLPFLLCDALGTALWTALLAGAGYLLGKDGVTLANLVSRYALASVCVLAAATAAPHLWRAWRRRGQLSAAPVTAAPVRDADY
jgi:membrane protein DedA with SNARE-associated domain